MKRNYTIGLQGMPMDVNVIRFLLDEKMTFYGATGYALELNTGDEDIKDAVVTYTTTEHCTRKELDALLDECYAETTMQRNGDVIHGEWTVQREG